VKPLLQFFAVALTAGVGFFAGRNLGPDQPSKILPPAAAPPAGASENVPSTTPSERAALTEAYEVLTRPDQFDDYSTFYGAVEKLTLEQIRELHRRVMAIPVSRLLEVVADRWVRLDPAHAAEFVRNFPDGLNVVDRTGLIAAWARHFPEEAIEKAVSLGKSSKSALLLDGAFTALVAKDPESAASKLGLIADEKQRVAVFDSCMATWARQDPVAATRWLQSHPESYGVGANGNEIVARFAREVAVRDLTTALEFSRNLADPLRQQAQLAVATEWAIGDPATALAWCLENQLPITELATSKIGSVLGHAMTRGPEKTAGWIESLPPGDERSEIAGYALRFAKAALAPKLFALVPEDQQPAYAGYYMRSLNNKKVGAALQWATSLPEGNLRVAALEDLITDFRFSNPVEIIDAFAAGPSRDAAYAAHIRKSVGSSPAGALDQLSKISNLELRREMAVEGFREWKKVNPAAAAKWLEETPHIAAEMKARLTQPRRAPVEE